MYLSELAETVAARKGHHVNLTSLCCKKASSLRLITSRGHFPKKVTRTNKKSGA